jgi:hypothetical protein
MTSPGCRRRAATGSNEPSARRRSTLAGSRRISASSDPAVRSRSRCSSRRPDSRKNTNIVTESYQTSAPSGPAGSSVAAVLAPNAITMPRATGTSMPMRAWTTSRSADAKNGRQENSSNGTVSTQDAQRSSAWMSGVMSPGSAMYAG